MAHTYHDLKTKTVAELREIAKGIQHDAVQGYSQMNKDRLLPALCRALNVDMAEHHVARGIDKPAIKARMRELKGQRAELLQTHNHDALKNIRRQLHALNRQIRSHLS
jgi:folylpolyglutamate synthase/dihydropteroate synthase